MVELSGRQATVETLRVERRMATFDVRSLTHFLDGGKEMTETAERIMREFGDDPLMCARNDADMTLPEIREAVMKRILRLWEMFQSDDAEARDKRVELLAVHDPQLLTRMGVHFGLFFGTISGQGTAEQQEKWGTPALLLQIVGCFGMTELGHGSFVRGIETTAEFDSESDEIVINTPSDTATKWWIGGAAHSATHCSVFAQLIVKGERKGVHAFVVPIRDTETGWPLPGVEIGDIGAKMGRHGIDNGWIRFDHVRVPRMNMLMKHAKLSRDGVYTKPAKAQLAYGALVMGRTAIMRDAANALKAAVTIAVRYAAVRRQFSIDEEGQGDASESGNSGGGGGDGIASEVQVLDYQTHQHKLLPLVATAYAFHFAAMRIKQLNDSMETSLHSGDYNEALPLLADVHGSSAGLKAMCTWTTQAGLEVCRQSLGGHGYSAYTGIAVMSADFAVNCTWEGDNTVLALQTARALLATSKKALAGEKVVGSMSYLSELLHPRRHRTFAVAAADAPSTHTNTSLMSLLRDRCLACIRSVMERMDGLRAEGGSEAAVWNECAVDLVECAKAHCIYFIAREFHASIEQEGGSAVEGLDGRGVRPVLRKVLRLYLLHEVDKDAGAYVREGVINSKEARHLHTALRSCISDLRADAVGLVDAFNLSDSILKSPLGANDGDVYGHYLDRVRSAHPPPSKAPYWESVIKPRVSKL